jgi:hypothetical protein
MFSVILPSRSLQIARLIRVETLCHRRHTVANQPQRDRRIVQLRARGFDFQDLLCQYFFTTYTILPDFSFICNSFLHKFTIKYIFYHIKAHTGTFQTYRCGLICFSGSNFPLKRHCAHRVEDDPSVDYDVLFFFFCTRPATLFLSRHRVAGRVHAGFDD